MLEVFAGLESAGVDTVGVEPLRVEGDVGWVLFRQDDFAFLGFAEVAVEGCGEEG